MSFIGKLNWKHQDWIWWCFCFSVLVLPLFPAMGAVGLFILTIKIWQTNFSLIISDRHNQALGILVILLIISCAVADRPQEAWLGLANFVPFFWLFVAIKELIKQPTQLKQLSWILILPSLPIVILGFGQLYLLWDSPSWLEAILGWELIPQGVPEGRMSSVFIYTNFLAVYLAIAFTLALGLWLNIWQTWRRKPQSRKTGVLFFLAGILLVDIAGLILTSSRNAWGLALISFLAYALFMGWRWLIWAVMGAATTILWASFAPRLGGIYLRQIVPAFFWARLSDQIYDRPIETLRITQWQFCWDLIKSRPWFGWGLRNFSPLYEAKTNYWFGHPHNLFLMFGAETGIICTLLLIGIVGLAMYQATILFLNWSDQDSLEIYFSYLLVFMCCVLFNLSDVTVFDLRVNTIIWLMLSAISGIVLSRSTSH